MPRNIFFRDFTLCKAGLLVGLISLAGWMGEVPNVATAKADPAPERVETLTILPAALIFWQVHCDKEKWVGIAL